MTEVISPVSLAEMQPGQSGVVESFDHGDSHHTRLLELGLLPGTHVRLMRIAPLGDPLIVELRGYQLSLRKVDAVRVQVRLNANATPQA